MERVLLWLAFAAFAAFASIGARQRNRSGAGWFFIGLALGPFGLLVHWMPKAAVPGIEGHAEREGHERRKRDGMDMSMSSSGPGDMK